MFAILTVIAPLVANLFCSYRIVIYTVNTLNDVSRHLTGHHSNMDRPCETTVVPLPH